VLEPYRKMPFGRPKMGKY